MAKLSRIYQRVFGSGAGLDQIAQFGSKFAGTPTFTTDPSTAQSLSNWLTGWFAAAIGGNAPAIEDMNAAMFVMTYQLAYYQQAGVPEWDPTTPYYMGSIANDGNGAIFVSLTDNNVNNTLSDAANWTKIGGKVMAALGDIIYGGVNGAQTALSGNTAAVRKFLAQTGTGSASAAPVWVAPKTPTIQTFLTPGSGTYTTPAGVLYIRVKGSGGGGGGGGSGGSGASNGGTGGTTSFDTLASATGGVGGNSPASGSDGGGGGTATVTGPAIGLGLAGNGGGAGGLSTSTAATLQGGAGGGSALFGGGGSGPARGSTSGVSGAANSGGGGSGGASVQTPVVGTAGGGGGGGSFDIIIASPSATYSYSVGAGGTIGAFGTNGSNGGLGGSGILVVEEYYQ